MAKLVYIFTCFSTNTWTHQTAPVDNLDSYKTNVLELLRTDIQEDRRAHLEDALLINLQVYDFATSKKNKLKN
jgi:hypothetical protein